MRDNVSMGDLSMKGSILLVVIDKTVCSGGSTRRMDMMGQPGRDRCMDSDEPGLDARCL